MAMIRSSALAFFLLAATSAFAQVASYSIDANLASGSPAIAGTNLQFTIDANNEGPDDAQNVVVSFNTPTNTTFVSITAPPGWTCNTPAPSGTGPVSCSTPTLVPGSEAHFLTVTTPSSTPRGTVIELDATITSTTTDKGTNDNSVTVTVPVDWISVLNVSKGAPATANAGATFNYTITINDQGPSSAGDLTLTDVLPVPLLFQSVNAPGWSCTTPPVGTNGTVTCTIAEIPTGITTVTISVSTASSATPTTIQNSVSVASTTDPQSPRTANASTQLVASANLAITKSGPPLAFAGEALSYAIDVNNGGPSDAQSLTMTDVLPASLRFQSINAPGWSCTAPPVGTSGTVTCTLATLVGSASASTITINALVASSVTSGSVISNTATVSSSTNDPATPNTSTVNTTIQTHADLAITIADAPDPVNAGSNITYTVVATNNGTADAANAVVAVTLPSGLSLVSITPAPGWTCTTNCTISSFAAGTNATFTIVAKANQGPSATTTASISSSTTEIDPSNNTASATTTILSPASVSATKNVVGSQFFENQTVTYTVMLSNSATTAQLDNGGDEMTDVLPSTLTLVSASASGGTAIADIANNTVHWNGSIAGNGSVTITIVASIHTGTAGTTISNTATTHYDADGNGTNETTGASNTATFSPLPASAVPAMSTLALAMLAAALALIALTTKY